MGNNNNEKIVETTAKIQPAKDVDWQKKAGEATEKGLRFASSLFSRAVKAAAKGANALDKKVNGDETSTDKG